MPNTTAPATTPAHTHAAQLVASKPDNEMGTLQFISSMTASLAWPLLVLTVVLIFKKDIAKLIHKLKKASVGGASVELALEENEAQLELIETLHVSQRPEQAEEPAGGPKALGSLNEEVDRKLSLAILDALTMLDPLSAVLNTWDFVQDALRIKAIMLGVEDDLVEKNEYVLAKHMHGRLILDTKMMILLAELRKTRNLAVHEGQDVTQDVAKRYADQAIRFIRLINEISTSK